MTTAPSTGRLRPCLWLNPGMSRTTLGPQRAFGFSAVIISPQIMSVVTMPLLPVKTWFTSYIYDSTKPHNVYLSSFFPNKKILQGPKILSAYLQATLWCINSNKQHCMILKHEHSFMYAQLLHCVLSHIMFQHQFELKCDFSRLCCVGVLKRWKCEKVSKLH